MNNKCRFNKSLTPFMDGELSEERANEIRKHLAGCESCKNEIDSLLSCNSLLKGLSEIEPSHDFDRVFQQKLLQDEEKEAGRIFFGFLFSAWRPYIAVAVSILLVAGFLFFSRTHDSLSTEEIMIAGNIELLEDFEIVNRLELLENWDDIMETGSESG